MRTIIKSILVASLSTLMLACAQPESKQHNHLTQTQKDVQQGSASASAAVTLKNETLNAIFPHYMQLTAALTAGDVAKAKVAALAIEAGARQMSSAEKLAASAAGITAATNLDSQRALFSALNDSFIQLLKTSGTDAGVLYIAHCPMALNDRGAYWVSNIKEIRNPYFGDSMLTCGAVKETI